MNIGILREIKPNEYRVAATPDAVRELTDRGHSVIVETKAGCGSGFSDEEYRAAGARVAPCKDVWAQAELIYKVKEVLPPEYQYLRQDKVLITYIHSNAHPEETDVLLQSKITAIAYEDVMDDTGHFPLLSPMSKLAGQGGFLAALHYSQSIAGGAGTLLANVCGMNTPVVTIIGAGNSGVAAASLAAAFGNTVRLLDISHAALENAKAFLPENVTCLFSNRSNLERCLRDSDILINCILWPKTRKDHLVSEKDLALMKKTAMIVDVACDENGAIETCRSTTHNDPIYTVNGIRHYCVDNIPSAFARTATTLLCNATLPFVTEIAGKGVQRALKENAALRKGLTCCGGILTLKETADKQGRPWTDAEELVKTFKL